MLLAAHIPLLCPALCLPWQYCAGPLARGTAGTRRISRIHFPPISSWIPQVGSSSEGPQELPTALPSSGSTIPVPAPVCLEHWGYRGAGSAGEKVWEPASAEVQECSN